MHFFKDLANNASYVTGLICGIVPYCKFSVTQFTQYMSVIMYVYISYLMKYYAKHGRHLIVLHYLYNYPRTKLSQSQN